MCIVNRLAPFFSPHPIQLACCAIHNWKPSECFMCRKVVPISYLHIVRPVRSVVQRFPMLYNWYSSPWRLEAGGWRMEDGGWRLEAGGWRGPAAPACSDGSVCSCAGVGILAELPSRTAASRVPLPASRPLSLAGEGLKADTSFLMQPRRNDYMVHL